MGYSLGQAARAAGRSKTTIHRAIKSGRLSAASLDSGGYDIDPAEVERVYPGNGFGNGQMERSVTEMPPLPSLEQLRGERDRFRALAEEREETIRDLRSRLDAEAEERRRLIMLLTDRRSFWRRWLR